jgi:diguanylate cyclase (GGDEF)-like protein
LIVTTILVVLVLVLSILLYLSRKSDTIDHHIETFIELNNNITVITSETEILAMNRVGLDFFGFKTFKAFRQKHKFLSKLFVEISSDDTRYVEGINWVTKIDKMQNIKVEMQYGDMKQVFYMQVSKIKEDRYQVTFYNITRVMAEKDAIEEVAQKDQLTQIYNRTKFNSILSIALRNFEIYNEPFTIILFDIDHFKHVNDKFGHTVGDQVLVQLSTLVKHQLRSHDTFARWGGEEFIILSESSSSQDAYLLAERLREAVESFPFDEVKRITCSFGVTECEISDTPMRLLNRADEALYKAKSSGRNKVCR